MGKDNIFYKAAKKNIRKLPMPSSLMKEFQKNGLEDLLEKVYLRSAELFDENKNANKALHSHLGQILPCIAFFEVLVEKEGSREKALEIYEKWSLSGMDKIEKSIQRLLKFPGLYKLVPGFVNFLIDKVYGADAGFKSVKVPGAKGFARDMKVCPYEMISRDYGYPELTKFFCKADDICYGSMHPKLVWARTKTLGRGNDYCDFRLFVNDHEA